MTRFSVLTLMSIAPALLLFRSTYGDNDTCAAFKDCCELDCCGPGTSWDPSSGKCIKDPFSPGWDGSHPPTFEQCAPRICCEDECCDPPNTVYEVDIHRCIEGADVDDNNSSSTSFPTPSFASESPSSAPSVTLSNTIAISTKIRNVQTNGHCNHFSFRIINIGFEGLGPRTGPFCQASGSGVTCNGGQLIPYAFEVPPDILPTAIQSYVYLNPSTGLVDPLLFLENGYRCLVFYEVVYRVECGDAKLGVAAGSGCFVDVDGAVVCPPIPIDCTQGCGPRTFPLDVLANNVGTTDCTDTVFLTGEQ